MTSFSDTMSDRFMMFSVNLINLEKQICKTYAGRHIYGQLFRSGTSAGANYEEARAGESSADFIHKMQISLKEFRESHYWIGLISAAKLIDSQDSALIFIRSESKELANIIAKSIFTAKTKILKKTNKA